MTFIDFQGYIFLGIVVIFMGYGEGLRNVRITIPRAIKRNETAVLMCTFDLEGDPLYTVKWYKGRSEFFRFTPKDEFPIKIFPLEGLYIDRNKSNETILTIERVQPSLSGTYNCEVSAEQSFHTALVAGFMEVVDTPQIDPKIDIERRRYKIGDEIEANCTTDKSNPPANITWYINGDLASPNQVVRYLEDNEINREEYTPISSKSGIQFTATSHNFLDGRLLLKCSAAIHTIWHRSKEISIEEEGRTNGGITQKVRVPSYINDVEGNGHKERRYDFGWPSGSPRTVERYSSSLSIFTTIIPLILILR